MKITHLLAGSLMMIFLSALSLSSSAQMGGGGGGNRMAQYQQMLKDSVGLTDVQADSVIAIRREFGPQMRAIYTDQSLSQDDKTAKLKPINDQIAARYAGFLTADQISKLQALQQRQMGRMRNRQGGGGGGN